MQLVLIYFTVLTAFSSQPEFIFWRADVLQWSHFKTLEKSDDGFDALIATGIQITTRDSAEHTYIELKSYLEPSESWVQKGSKTAQLLNHEQRHFDITEISRRRLSMAIQTTENINAENRSMTIDRLFDNAMQWQSDISDTYDAETNHGLNMESQERWNNKIDNLLVQYESFSGSTINLW